MKRRSYMIGVLAAGLAFTAAFGSPRICRIVSSAQSFEHHFRALQSNGSPLGPVERFVYSLILANNNPQPCERPVSHPQPRT